MVKMKLGEIVQCSNKTLGELKVKHRLARGVPRRGSNKTLGELKDREKRGKFGEIWGSNKTLGELKGRIEKKEGCENEEVPIRL